MTLAAVASVVSCTRIEYPVGDNSQEVLVPAGDYIFFDSEVMTKGDLVSDMADKDFGVIGYKFNGEWDVVKPMAKPNVFHSQQVDWKGGAHTYDASGSSLNTFGTPLIPWESGMRYTFGAYYPYGKSYLTLSGTNVEGEPYVDYTMSMTDPSELADVMTSFVENTFNATTNSVTFTMKHRLSAIDVKARNFIEPVDGRQVSIKITRLSVIFDNLAYSGVSYWFDPTYQVSGSSLPSGIRSRTTNSLTAEYEIRNTDIIIPSSSAGGSDYQQNIAEEGKKLLIIPQEMSGNESLTGQVSFDYEYVDDDGYAVSIGGIDHVTGQVMDFETGMEIAAGQRYTIQISFLSGALSIDFSSTPVWDDVQIRDIEFN